MKRNLYILVIVLVFCRATDLYAQTYTWSDSVLATLTLDEKIAQLMMIRVHSNKDASYNKEMAAYVEKYQVGGLCFFQGGPYRQAVLTNELQGKSRIPMLVAIDGEWGLAMRLDSVQLYPRQMALGATADTAMIYQMGRSMALQCKRLGVHVNFAPCVDVNNNAQNPVINSRSFGGDPQWVARCGIAYMKGMQDNGVMACAKHFPGHGDTKVDSHKSTPQINHNKHRLTQVELFPFQQMINSGVDAMMVGHLFVPALDSAKNAIATCSPKITNELLQQQMNFKGLVFTDALEMGGIVSLFPRGELEVQCLIAGADVLLLPNKFDVVSMAVKQAVLDGRLTIEDINKKCLKVLQMKEKYVLPNAREIALNNIWQDINSNLAKEVYKKLTQESITLLVDKHHIVPLQSSKKALLLTESKNGGKVLLENLDKNIDIKQIVASQSLADKKSEIYAQINNYDYILVSLHNLNQTPQKSYGLNSKTIAFLDSLTKGNKPVVLLLMGNPYALNELSFADRFAAIMVAYHPVAIAEEAVALALLGKNPICGKLPVQLTHFPMHTSVEFKCDEDKAASKPHVFYKNKIDEIVHHAIQEQAFPGCQVLIAQKGNVLYKKSYGTISYQDKRPVTDSTIYDLATLTKVMATTLAVMKLYDEGKIKLKAKLGDYLSILKGSNKENLTIAEVMTHTAGLPAWIPFYKKWTPFYPDTIASNQLKEDLWQTNYSPQFAINVAENLYFRTEYYDTIYQTIINCKMNATKNYLYSDLGFYLLAEIVKTLTGKPLDVYLAETFYRPMGLTYTLFNPLEKYPSTCIAPTEEDTLFRHQLLCGYVHDQGAALLGGVSGHAGLFSTADNLFAIAQMLLNEGVYKGKRYLSAETVALFTSYYYPNGHTCRRGIGFDKPARGKAASPCCKAASPLSYGHSGFTGTFLWIDPRYDLIYIFLSNRVCPNAENNKITTMSVRSNIHSFAYKMVE